MNDIARSRPKLRLLILTGLVFGLVLAGTSKPSLAAPPERDKANKKKITITLHLDGSGNPDAVNTPAPDPVPLSKGKGHWAHWQLDPSVKGDLAIVMKNGTEPFSQQPDCHGKECLSDPPTASPRTDPYTYLVRVTLKDSGKVLTLDPGIRVDP